MYNKIRGVKEEPRRPPGLSRISSPIPAPGGLELVQAFVNTASPASDELRTPRGLSDWLSRNGLLPAGTELTKADLERARDARTGLRALLVTNGGGRLNNSAVARLDRATVGARAQIRFDRHGTSRFELISRDLDDALGVLLGNRHPLMKEAVPRASGRRSSSVAIPNAVERSSISPRAATVDGAASGAGTRSEPRHVGGRRSIAGVERFHSDSTVVGRFPVADLAPARRPRDT